MAINANPRPVLCADSHRHPNGERRLATALIRGDGRLAFTGRCDPCVRALAAAPAEAVLVDVYDLGPARISARYDPETAAH